jgi:hypothetical protein
MVSVLSVQQKDGFCMVQFSAGRPSPSVQQKKDGFVWFSSQFFV